MMNTQATQHPPSAIEVMTDVLLLANDDNEHEIADAIVNIWLPIFRSELNLAMALDALRVTYSDVATVDLCDRYLDAIRGMK